MESQALEANVEGMLRQFSEARLGQVFATVLSLAFMSVGAYVALHGQPWAGGAMGSLGIVTVITRMILGRERSSEKQDAVEQ